MHKKYTWPPEIPHIPHFPDFSPVAGCQADAGRRFWTNDKKTYLCKRLTGTEVEDSTLIARVKAGDRNAFNELYGLYWASLVNYAGLFVGDDGAEDVVQDVFVRIWLHRDNLRDDGSLQGYLLRSVYHASLNALKKGANATAYRSWVAQQIEQSCYAHYDPDNSEIIRKLYSQEVAGEIDAAIESLSPKCREVFRMSHIEGLSNREISEQLGITLSTVENHIYNALKQLRQKLSHYKMLIFLTMYILGK